MRGLSTGWERLGAAAFLGLARSMADELTVGLSQTTNALQRGLPASARGWLSVSTIGLILANLRALVVALSIAITCGVRSLLARPAYL